MWEATCLVYLQSVISANSGRQMLHANGPHAHHWCHFDIFPNIIGMQWCYCTSMNLSLIMAELIRISWLYIYWEIEGIFDPPIYSKLTLICRITLWWHLLWSIKMVLVCDKRMLWWYLWSIDSLHSLSIKTFLTYRSHEWLSL